jgi:hypothetical protein
MGDSLRSVFVPWWALVAVRTSLTAGADIKVWRAIVAPPGSTALSSTTSRPRLVVVIPGLARANYFSVVSSAKALDPLAESP